MQFRKVVTDKEGTASLADIYGYDVEERLEPHRIMEIRMKTNTFISVFPSKNQNMFCLLC